MEQIKLVFTKLALNNLIDITNYYEGKQEGLGPRFATYLKKSIELLEQNLNLGHSGKVFGTRELVFQEFPYIVVYRVRKSYVQLLLIHHQSRTYP